MAKQTTSKKAPAAPKAAPKRKASEAPEPITQVLAKAELRAPAVVEAAISAAPTHDAIAARAYELYQMRQPWEGSPMNDWLRAESDLGA